MEFDTLTVRREGAVLLAEIAAPPMNLLGPELLRDLVSLIHRAEGDGTVQVLVFASADPDYFERIRARLHEASEGRGGALTVEGPAGMGKTALLTAVREAAETDGFRILRARGAELESDFAFGVVRQLVERLLAETSPVGRAALLEGPARLALRLLAIVGAEDGTGEAGPVAPDPSFAVLHGLYWLCANLADQGPVLLVVDDAHWADAPSLRFLAYLLPRLDELRIAVLLAARPADAGPGRHLLTALTMDPATEVVRLAPLTSDGVARLIARGLGSEPAPGFVAACREATGGTPFLVHTLVGALAEEGIDPVEASSERISRLASATTGRWALLQLSRLGPDATRLARAVAVLEWCDLAEAAALARLGPTEAVRAAELLVRVGVLADQPLAFAHPLLRTGVYGEMSAAERSVAHGRAARLLSERVASADRVAEHLVKAYPTEDQWVVAQLRAAARAATASGAPESAVAYLRRALAEPPPQEARVSLLLDLGLAEFNASQPQWEQHLTGALAGAADDASQVDAALHLGRALAAHLRFVEAVEVCDGVSAGLDHDSEAWWTLESSAIAWGMTDPDIAPSLSGRAASLVRRAREQRVSPQVEAVAANRAAVINDPADGVAELARRAVAGGIQELAESGEGQLLTFAVRALFLTERYPEAQGLLDAAIAGARAAGNRMVLPELLSIRAWLGVRRGDLAAAEADARAVSEVVGEGAATRVWWPAAATGALVGALVERGDLDAAEQALAPLAPGLAHAAQRPTFLLFGRGRLRLAQRRFSEAAADFLVAGELAIRGGAISPTYMAWRSGAALAKLRLGDAEAARRLSAEELELARAFGTPRAIGVALRVSGLAANAGHGERLLREAIAVLDGPDTRLERARAQADLGALLRRGDRRAEAREQLRDALDVAHRAGARLLAERAETELRATGAKPRRILLTGREALTPSERRIAELAADGLSNAQIAQALFLTVRTVEGHLTNVFSKLDVERRAQLHVALAAPTQAVRA